MWVASQNKVWELVSEKVRVDLVILQEKLSLLLSSETNKCVGAQLVSRVSTTLTSMAAPGFITREISSNRKSHYRPKYWGRGWGGGTCQKRWVAVERSHSPCLQESRVLCV
jgi:hypothetical protein